MVNRFFLSIHILLFSFGVTTAQQFDLPVEKREAVASYPDSTVRVKFLTIAKTNHSGNSVEYYWFYANKINSNVGAYLKNPLQDLYSVFDTKNRLITQGYFKKGTKTGIWLQWYSNGNLRSKTHFRKSYKYGRAFLYNEMGLKTTRLKYRKNKLHGNVIRYYADSTVKEKWRKNVFISKKVKYLKPSIDTLNQKSKNANGDNFLFFFKKKPKAEKQPLVTNTVDSSPTSTPNLTTKKWYQFWKHKNVAVTPEKP